MPRATVSLRPHLSLRLRRRRHRLLLSPPLSRLLRRRKWPRLSRRLRQRAGKITRSSCLAPLSAKSRPQAAIHARAPNAWRMCAVGTSALWRCNRLSRPIRCARSSISQKIIVRGRWVWRTVSLYLKAGGADLVRFFEERVHRLVAEAEMVSNLMHQNVRDEVRQRDIAAIDPLIEDGSAIEKHHRRHS